MSPSPLCGGSFAFKCLHLHPCVSCLHREALHSRHPGICGPALQMVSRELTQVLSAATKSDGDLHPDAVHLLALAEVRAEGRRALQAL